MAYINGMFVTKWDYINIFTWKIKESVMVIKVILITNSTKTQIITLINIESAVSVVKLWALVLAVYMC